MTVRTQREGPVTLVIIDRPERRNAVDGPAAAALTDAFAAFDRDGQARVAVLTGTGGTFCAGSDLKAMAAGEFPIPTADGPPPLGPTRMRLGLLNLPKGMPCLDGGSVRLPRLIGHGRALDLLLTGRRVSAAEALAIGLVSRLAAPGTVAQAALSLARQIAAFPPDGLLAARDTATAQWGLTEEQALRAEAERGLSAVSATA